MTIAEVAVKMASPKNKMGFLQILFNFHKVRRFFKGRAEPVFEVFRKHPITRGMASYLLIWPVGNIIQQTLSDQEEFDVWKIVRFGLYGSLITAPTLYGWVRLTTAMWPNTSFRIACAKAIVEQFSYTPLAMAIFFYSMTWLETFSAVEAWAEVKAKLAPTYCIAVTFWPVIGTVNFAVIPERNRVFFVSCFSLLWTIYLAHVKNQEREKLLPEEERTKIEKIQ